MSNLGEHLSSLQVFIVTDGDTENILECLFYALVFSVYTWNESAGSQSRHIKAL